ncbi:MAG: flagellin [Betaproteobacteria bacterium]
MSVINTNLKALSATVSAFNADKAQSTAMQRLSTGLRINSAKDDAAGLAITNRMTSQVRGLAVATRNANDGISMAQTADGALGNVTDILQRMRELAVQSANASNSADNRTAIQAEVSQLKTQIDQIATTTNFNDIKLMDGTAGKVDLQIGVDQGQTMTMSFDSAKTKDIGLGARASLTSIGKTTTAMAWGDLTINGVLVGPSLAFSDNASVPANAAGSAIAKAAAINAVSAQTGVTATVSGTVTNGSQQTAAALTGTVTINGIATASFSTTTDAAISRSTTVNAINAISSQTGVTAIDSGDDIHGVTLSAKDGRNITVLHATLTAAATGLNADGTYVGTYQLSNPSNSPIVLSSRMGGTIANADLTAGTYQANTAQVITKTRAVAAAATAPAVGTTGLLNGSTLKLNGVVIGAALSTDDTSSDTTAASSTKAASAIAIAAAINKSANLTGVTASAKANVLQGGSFTAGATVGIYLNGVTITSTLGAQATRADVANMINQYSNRTGVVASDNGSGVTYTAADGRNISLGVDAASSAAAIGLGDVTASVGATAVSTGAITTYAQVALQSDKQFTVASGTQGDSNLNLLGFQTGTFGGADNGLKIAAVDVSTASGAQNAITAIDAALKTVSLNQSKAGAYLNRLDSVVSNLATMSTNITASRSRILDTDYSAETTNLAKSQIISQAATAMLAQANQSAQNVLALLK